MANWGDMIVVPQDQQLPGLTGRALAPPSYLPEPAALPAPPLFQTGPGQNPNTDSTFGAAFGLNNEVVGALDLLTRPTFKPDPAYDVSKDPLVTGPDSKYGQYHLDRFVGVQSSDEAKAVMARIDREEQQQATIARSGTAGTLMNIAAGTLSPTVAIPVAGWLGDIARFGKAGYVALRTAEAAAGAGAGVAAQEAILHQAQETRTAAESFWNVAGASVLGGILGGAVSAATLGRLVHSVGGDLAANPIPRAASAGAAATDAARGSGALAPSFGVAEALKKLTPGLRTQASPLEATRNTVRDLAAGEQLAENSEGIPSSLGGSAEAQAKAAHGPLGDAQEQLRSLYSDYFFGAQRPLSPTQATIARLVGRGDGRMSYAEFNQAIADAQLAGDVHAVPQVEAAAKYLRENVYNPLRDEAMNVIPGFREMVDAGSADAGYLTRIWNRNAVNAMRDELQRILTDHFAAVQGEAVAKGFGDSAAQLTRQELQDAAEKTIQQIMGGSPVRMQLPNEFNVGAAGPLKERALSSLPTAAVMKFVERDAEKIAQFYTRALAPDVALAKKFGSIDMKEQIQKIRDEQYARGRDQTAAVRDKLRKQADSDIRDLTAMRDRLRGTYRLPTNPEGLLHRLPVINKALQFLSTLGNMTLSSASDIAKPVFIHGLTRVMGTAFSPLVTKLATIRLAAKEVKLAGTALDMIANDRALAFSDLMDEYGHNTAVERGLQQATKVYSVATLMAPWNATLKQFSGIITQTRALQGIEALASGGKIPAKEITYLAEGGIDRGLADRIAKQFSEHGMKDGAVWNANTRDWTDQQAVLALRSFINRDVDRIIVTPGIGDKSLWMSGDLGSTIGQFQSFAIASIQKTLVTGLQLRDMAALNGSLLMLALGAFSYWAKTQVAGGTVSSDPRVWASEAVDQSGILGILMNGDHIIEKITGDKIGVSALTGQPARRYINVNAAGSILGPTAGRLFDILDLSHAISTGTITAADAGRIRRLLPLQNLFWMRWLFDSAQQGAIHAFNIPTKRAA